MSDKPVSLNKNGVDNDAIYADYTGPMGEARKLLHEQKLHNGQYIGHFTLAYNLGSLSKVDELAALGFLVPLRSNPGWYEVSGL